MTEKKELCKDCPGHPYNNCEPCYLQDSGIDYDRKIFSINEIKERNKEFIKELVEKLVCYYDYDFGDAEKFEKIIEEYEEKIK